MNLLGFFPMFSIKSSFARYFAVPLLAGLGGRRHSVPFTDEIEDNGFDDRHAHGDDYDRKRKGADDHGDGVFR